MKQMKLFHFPYHTGSHAGGWRHPDAAPGGLLDLSFYRSLAQLAERGKFDALFFADPGGFNYRRGRDSASRLDVVKPEPITLLAALAGATTHIGLVGTASTSNNHPYNLARQFASLDHLSGGRAGWNIVTSAQQSVARQYGFDDVADHDERYARAREFVDVARALWDSFEDGAVVRDKATGRYFDPDRLHGLAHEGRFFKVSGPLDIARPPQGHPVLVQAGGSATGQQFAADIAEVIFTTHPALDTARAFYATIKSLAVKAGRSADAVKILPSLLPIIGATESEARAKERELDDLISTDVAIGLLEANLGGVDLSAYPLDGPLPDLPLTNRIQGIQKRLLDMARDGNMTIRQVAHRHAAKRTGYAIVGTAEQVADGMEGWFRAQGADGFIVTAPYLPGGFEIFVDQVVPILQRRGLFRTDYEGPTLRDQLGLQRPDNGFVLDPSRHREPQIW